MKAHKRPVVLGVIAEGSPTPSHCLLAPRNALWLATLPMRYGATFVSVAGAIDLFPESVHISPLLFLQAVPSNPS